MEIGEWWFLATQTELQHHAMESRSESLASTAVMQCSTLGAIIASKPYNYFLWFFLSQEHTFKGKWSKGGAEEHNALPFYHRVIFIIESYLSYIYSLIPHSGKTLVLGNALIDYRRQLHSAIEL